MKERDYDLTEEEQQVLSDYEAGQFQSVSNLAERKEELQSVARNTQNKTRNINIRVSEKDLYRLKAKAIEEGIPYQTLVSSILHKAVSTTRIHMPISPYPVIPFTPIGMSQTFKEDSYE